MAREMEKKSSASGDAEVTNCVSNLIHAFTNGLDIFKRLRERRRKRKHHHHHKDPTDSASNAELQLSNSLRKGPQDIYTSYENHYHKAGDRFAKGDAIAHASLVETLTKLNTGLVGIIAAFLNHDSKTNRLNLDYKSLTSLSDVSRMEAIKSMDQLYLRLSHSQLQLYQTPGTSQTSRGRAGPDKRKQVGSRQRSNGPMIARMPIKKSSQTQLVMMRPKTTRKGSSSSGSSTRSPSTAPSPPYTSPIGSPMDSPLPQYAPVDPFPHRKQPSSKANASTGRKRADSFDGPRPTTWPNTRPDATMPLRLPPPKVPPKVPLPQKSPPPRAKHTPSPSTGPTRRRMDKLTPSQYTFASDSTKLGEIPQRNWTTPWDREEAERLNAEALANGYPQPAVETRQKQKKGLFNFLRRGSTQAS